MVMVSLHSNRNPKTEVVIRDWGIDVKGLTIFLFGGIWTLVLWVRKAVECFTYCLMGHSSRSMKDSCLKSDLNLRRRILAYCLEIIFVIFW